MIAQPDALAARLRATHVRAGGTLDMRVTGLQLRQGEMRLHERRDHPRPERALFRDCMSRVASAVHIVTTDGVAGLGGITASAVASVSDDPATMLVCVNKSSHSAPRFIANKVFCINTLAADDQALADCFAGRTGLHLDARFQPGIWDRLASGAPVLGTAIAIFDCRVLDIQDVATHHVMIGEVLAVRLLREGKCLAYHDRRYLAV